MLWYLANGSLNDYLKSQVTLQSNYYSSQEAKLLSADFSNNTGVTNFTNFSLSNIDGLTQPLLFKVDNMSVQLAAVPTHQLDAPSIQKKTTTIVYVKELRLKNLQAWSEVTQTGKTNLEVLYNIINTRLAKDYPALYPKTSAALYAKMYPERSETLALEALGSVENTQPIETNKAVISSNEIKHKNRLLGKAETRVIISSVIIDELTLTTIKNSQVTSEKFNNITLGRFGNESGLASNQLGGELLRQLLAKLISIEKNNAEKTK